MTTNDDVGKDKGTLPKVNVIEITLIAFVAKHLLNLIYKYLENSLITATNYDNHKSTVIKDNHRIYFCQTFHSRFFPVYHSFRYPVVFAGVDLNLLEKERKNFLLGYNNKYLSIFNIKDDDHLGQIIEELPNTNSINGTNGQRKIISIKEKALWHIRNHNIPTDDINHIELITMPRFLGYAFNPISIFYCYDKNNNLKVIILEVSNTFGEKHLYVLKRDQIKDHEAKKLGYEMGFIVKRSFHVSPYNDRKGIYKAFCKDPRLSGQANQENNSQDNVQGNNDANNVKDVSEKLKKLQFHKKFIAVLTGQSYNLTKNSLLYAIITYPFEIFLTVPRILKEAYKLHFKKQLGIFHRPIPFEETIVKLEPKLIDSYAKDLVVKYLNNLISKFPEPIKITIHLPSTNTQHPIKLYPPNNNDSAAIHKEIILKLHDYSFFTDILINQNLFRALIIGYFKNDNKYQNWVNLIRDWYWKRIFTSDWYGGHEAKKEFNRILLNDYNIPLLNNIFFYDTIGSANTKTTNIIKKQIHLFPFPSPKYHHHHSSIIKNSIDKMILSDSKNTLKLKYCLMIGYMIITSQLNAFFWQLITSFVDGPNGNPFLIEKWIWEGIVDLLKRSDNDMDDKNINLLNEWKVVYEKQ
ncbi:4952_t:CDS:2, partial [Entrophospora sp. SA101]